MVCYTILAYREVQKLYKFKSLVLFAFQIPITKLCPACRPNISLSNLQKFLSKGDQNKDGHLDFGEFVRYVSEHEKQLKLVFKDIDQNEDGKLDVNEIWASLQKLGVNVTREEADKLLKRYVSFLSTESALINIFNAGCFCCPAL